MALRQDLFFDCVGEPKYVHQYTILLRGYSTIPSARADFSFGINCRTVRSSTMVLIATHAGSLSCAIVGLRKAGKVERTPGRSSRRTFSIRPTRLYALMAPSSRSTMFSIFSRFQLSCHDTWLAMNHGADSSSVSTMRR